MSQETPAPQRYSWAKTGDINAFFGLMLDNIAGLILLVTLMKFQFGFPGDFAVSAMVPGTALGVLVGDLAFFALAFWLAKKSKNSEVTAMPLGLDTPSTFGMVFFVLGPSFLAGKAMGLDADAAAVRTWHIGIWCVLFSGILKLALAPFSDWIRRIIPRAGLLGSLAAIALVLISFIPLLDILEHPLPGLLALVIVLTSLIGRIELPGKLPGTLGALIIAGSVYYLMCAIDGEHYAWPTTPAVDWFPTQWLQSWEFGWVSALPDALTYLPIALPFALATVVGGIDCTESAAAAGDDYDTRSVIAIEGVATVLAALSGGVIQTTPYIGHPAYKAMGGRAAYTLATALFIGAAGLVGYFALINAWLPPAVVYPILVFVGLEITAQSFHATPVRHYAAVAVACLPALAFLAMNIPGQIFGDDTLRQAGIDSSALTGARLKTGIATLTMVSSNFILVSLLWAWTIASIIDRRLFLAGKVLIASGVLTLFGIIHSPMPGGRFFLPWTPASWESIGLAAEHHRAVFEFAAAYVVSGITLMIWSRFASQQRNDHATPPALTESAPDT